MDTARLVVCVPTYQRLHMLRDCLLSLEKLHVPEGFEVHVIVVDNDEKGGAKTIIDELSGNFCFPLAYFIEAERGLASVRNRMLEEALASNADYLAFIDDDEQADPLWLEQHLHALEKHGALVSCGPVRPIGANLEVKGKKPLADGSTPRHVSTNNVVFKNILAGAQGLRFDTYYNFIGGEDFDFFERSRDLGNRHVWAEGALVLETISPERDKLSYLFYRHYSGGINSVMRYKKNRSSTRAWFHYLPKFVGKVLGAVIYCLFSVLRVNKGMLAIAVKKFASGLGYVAGLFNAREARYATGPENS